MVLELASETPRASRVCAVPERMSNAHVIPLEEGWAKLEACLRRVEAGSVISSHEYSSLYSTSYTMCTQKPPNNWSEDVYNRWRIEAQQFSARAVARLAGKEGDQYVAALFVVLRGFDMYARFAEHLLKYLNRFYVPRLSLPGIYEVLAEAFSGALDLEATALGTGAEDRGRDIALLRGMQGRTRLFLKERDNVFRWTAEGGDAEQLQRAELKEAMLQHRRNDPLEQRWQACLAVQPAVASRRRALALMLVLCAKDPPRAELGDDPGRLSLVVRLARDGPFDHEGRSPVVPLILQKVTEEGTRELVRAVAALLEETAAAEAAAAAAAAE